MIITVWKCLCLCFPDVCLHNNLKYKLLSGVWKGMQFVSWVFLKEEILTIMLIGAIDVSGKLLLNFNLVNLQAIHDLK